MNKNMNEKKVQQRPNEDLYVAKDHTQKQDELKGHGSWNFSSVIMLLYVFETGKSYERMLQAATCLMPFILFTV